MNEWIDLKAEIGLAQASKDSKTWDKECNVTFYYYTLYYSFYVLYSDWGIKTASKKDQKDKIAF